ncbi:hypothetical protein GCM10022288_15620 [Gryllotalpicola kribbensis]|uniref:Uncharacterized protein n=1 Tax=Gryllotalpicola kribbensis TaxID=993084 RepID=A0ABP8ARK0_9MICO
MSETRQHLLDHAERLASALTGDRLAQYEEGVSAVDFIHNMLDIPDYFAERHLPEHDGMKSVFHLGFAIRRLQNAVIESESLAGLDGTDWGVAAAAHEASCARWLADRIKDFERYALPTA